MIDLLGSIAILISFGVLFYKIIIKKEDGWNTDYIAYYDDFSD